MKTLYYPLYLLFHYNDLTNLWYKYLYFI